MATAKKPREVLWTPVGRFSYPYLFSVDSGRKYSDDAYKTDLLIPKSIFKEKGRALQDAVLKVGREHFGPKFDLKSGKWRTPFKDTDTDDRIENDSMKNCILIRASSKPRKLRDGKVKPAQQPLLIGPRKGADGKFPPLSEAQVADIKGGDWGTLNVTIYPYDQSGGGVTLALNAVQFWKADDGFGQGRSKLVETAEELEAEIEAAENEDVASSEEADNDSIV